MANSVFGPDLVKEDGETVCYKFNERITPLPEIKETINCKIRKAVNTPTRLYTNISNTQKTYGPPQTLSTAKVLKTFEQNKKRDKKVLVQDDLTGEQLEVLSPLSAEGDTLEKDSQVTIYINKQTGEGRVTAAEC